MKKLNKLIAALALSSLAIGTYAYADSKDGYKKHDREATMEQRVNHKVDRMAKHLDLSDAQKAEMKQLMLKHKQEKQAQRKQMREDLQKILTPEQRKKMQEHIKERMEKRTDKHHEHKKHGEKHHKHEHHDDDD